LLRAAFPLSARRRSAAAVRASARRGNALITPNRAGSGSAAQPLAMVALDLALGHRVIGLAPGMRHAMFPEPGSELGGKVEGPLSLSKRGRCRTRTRSRPELRSAIVNVSETSLIGCGGRLRKVVGGFQQVERGTGNQIMRLQQSVDRSFRNKVLLLVNERGRQLAR
jgi:hypothetical protein